MRDMNVEKVIQRRISSDPYMEPYADSIRRRINLALETQQRLTGGKLSLADFASGHEYFGMHFAGDGVVFREWAPNATAIYLKGEFNNWSATEEFSLSRISDDGTWEIKLPAQSLSHGEHYRLEMRWNGGSGDRIPAWCRRVVQHEDTKHFDAQVWHPENPYQWQNNSPELSGVPLLIYESHIGMAQEDQKTGSYLEFRDRVLPRIKEAGYNAVQLMAIAEHPYYGSFGYQVSNFFACSSRFGTPEELKSLVDTAHGMGLLVFMDIVHSHAVKNQVEGIARFDGTEYQFFHKGPRGEHPAWDSKCFDYAKPQVLHFLLSNCRYWLDEFQFDGFRFDGVTSMIYTHHGLGVAFTEYEQYFNDTVDESALAYLTLANCLIHEVREQAVTLAEDMSGMPGLAIGSSQGGAGFDFRYAMGIPDYWIKLIKEIPDEQWPVGHLWHELTNRRKDEKSVSYAESHDQALVGDQTLISRLIGDRIYEHMSVEDKDPVVFRGISLHKMIRLITFASAGHGYLNFMGNEFGHPEWIDFPREGNNWSYKYARRQWSLAGDRNLYYSRLGDFDKAMLEVARTYSIPNGQKQFLLHLEENTRVIAFLRANLLFIFNFHPEVSYTDYWIPAAPGKYKICLDTDDSKFGGLDRQDRSYVHQCITDNIDRHFLSLYLPARTAIVLAPS